MFVIRTCGSDKTGYRFHSGKGAEVYNLVNDLGSPQDIERKTYKTLSGSSPTFAGWNVYPNGTCALNLCRKEGYHGALFVLSGLRLNLSCGFGRWDKCWMTGACRLETAALFFGSGGLMAIAGAFVLPENWSSAMSWVR